MYLGTNASVSLSLQIDPSLRSPSTSGHFGIGKPRAQHHGHKSPECAPRLRQIGCHPDDSKPSALPTADPRNRGVRLKLSEYSALERNLAVCGCLPQYGKLIQAGNLEKLCHITQ